MDMVEETDIGEETGMANGCFSFRPGLAGTAILALALVGLIGGGLRPAEARIVCKEGYRVYKDGRRLSTPRCQDLYLAEVARQYGTRVSGEEILNNPMRRQEVCAHIGQDIRVRALCEMVLPRRSP